MQFFRDWMSSQQNQSNEGIINWPQLTQNNENSTVPVIIPGHKLMCTMQTSQERSEDVPITDLSS